MMPAIICGQVLSKASGSPPLDIHESKRCFFSRASSSRASRKRSSSFRRAKSSSQRRRFSAFSFSHLICASISTSVLPPSKFGELFVRPCTAYLRRFSPSCYILATSCSSRSSSVEWLGACRYLYARARARCSLTSLSVSFAVPAPLPRTEDTPLVRRVRGRRDGGGHRGARGAADQCHLRREISEIPSPSALCIVCRRTGVLSPASVSCP